VDDFEGMRYIHNWWWWTKENKNNWWIKNKINNKSLKGIRI